MLPKVFYRVKFDEIYNTLESILKKFLKNYWFLFLISGLAILADQVTKALVRKMIQPGPPGIIPIKWLPFVKFIHITNDGIAFGMLQGAGWIFTILAFIVSIAIIYYFPKVSLKEQFIRWALAFQLGGALGNLIDRLIQKGQVTDFVAVGNFPVFNVADSCISIGTVALLIGVWIQEIREKREKKLQLENEFNKDAK
jgi:signal peptidase II